MPLLGDLLYLYFGKQVYIFILGIYLEQIAEAWRVPCSTWNNKGKPLLKVDKSLLMLPPPVFESVCCSNLF